MVTHTAGFQLHRHLVGFLKMSFQAFTPTKSSSQRFGEMVKFTLRLMTNVTISISTSQTFHSLVAIFSLRPPMAFHLTAHTRACSSYDVVLMSM